MASERENSQAPKKPDGTSSTYLGSLPEQDRSRILELAAQTSHRIEEWAKRYPQMRLNRTWAVSITVTAAAPFLPVDALAHMGRMSLWIFSVDDLFDEEHLALGEMIDAVASFESILAGNTVDPMQSPDNLALALQQIRDDLQEYTLFPALGSGWAHALRSTLRAMVREHEWRVGYRDTTTPQLPRYDDYLENGWYSIGGPPVIWVSLITIADRSTLTRSAGLHALERSVSICLRLSNDIRSEIKEIAEGNINSILLRQQEALAWAHDEAAATMIARERVQRDIEIELQRCITLRALVQTDSGLPERMMLNLAQFVCDFYARHDYHTVAEDTKLS